MRCLKLLIFTCTFTFLFLTFDFNVSGQVPDPYVSCPDTRTNEWHSLRPYQASPCNIPIKKEEQALICGNDLIVNDIIYIPGDPYQIIKCLPCTSCPGTTMCYIKAPRNFTIAFNAYESELPIAGNTEEVAGNSDWPDWVDTAVELAKLRESWRLKPEADTQGFSDHLPPDPLDSSRYPDFRSYYIAYQEWRGRSCIETPDKITIPVINVEIDLPGVFVCGELLGGFLKPNFWSNLFPKIPYSSTEDRLGKANVSDMVWVPGKSTVETIDPIAPGDHTHWNPKVPAYGADPGIGENETPLYFPHMEENVELTTLLQSTYLPKDLLGTEPSAGSNSEPLPAPNPDCKIVDVRYNPGDQLFGEKEGDLGVPNANVVYDAYFWCQARCVQVGFGYPPVCIPIPSCVKNAWFYSDVTIYTPMIDELFSRTVQGESSVFRRILPKVEAGAPVEKIEDIPAATAVTHYAKDNVTPNPPIQLISDPAEFYIPHFGSIYDYLLQGMQTAIRPKGFPGRPAGLIDDRLIPESDTVNEYLSWYLNGTINRSEDGPLKARSEEDRKRIINLSGPINKLLARDSQWRNIIAKWTGSGTLPPEDTTKQGRVDTTQKAKDSRHNQIAGCTISKTFTIPFIGKQITLGGIPVPCQSESQKNLPPPAASPSGGPQPPGVCPNVPDSEIDPKYLGATKDNFIRMADGWTADCPGPDNNLAEECYNYVVKTSDGKGVNSAFSLDIWLIESGASNYCHAPNVQDFGVNNAPPADIIAQLDGFLQTPFMADFISCSNEPGWKSRMHAFLYRFESETGACDQSDPDAYDYYIKALQYYQNICDFVPASCVTCNPAMDPSCTDPYFVIKWPTDDSCP